MVFTSENPLLGSQPEFLMSTVSLIMKRILEGRVTVFEIFCNLDMQESTIGLADEEESKSFPVTDMSWHSASTFSSAREPPFPTSSVMQTCMICSGTIFSLKSSPIKRMLPSVLCLTALSATSLSCTAFILSALSFCSAVPSNSSWQVFRRTRRKVMGLLSPSSDGKSGRSSLNFLQSFAYKGQKVGSATAFSKTRTIHFWRSGAELIPASRACLASRSNLSGVNLLRIPLMVRTTFSSLSSADVPADQALVALCIFISGACARFSLSPSADLLALVSSEAGMRFGGATCSSPGKGFFACQSRWSFPSHMVPARAASGASSALPSRSSCRLRFIPWGASVHFSLNSSKNSLEYFFLS
mmetsp:Transcript_8080/g.49921  ORF Transcript_8080/g.49921 Transcript_8080/m.49921 type:complete len:357 (-) Transcript_8080:405-1475(-)